MLARNLMYEVSSNRVTIQPTVVAANYVPIADIDSASLIPPNLPFNNSMDPLQFKVNRGSFQVLLR